MSRSGGRNLPLPWGSCSQIGQEKSGCIQGKAREAQLGAGTPQNSIRNVNPTTHMTPVGVILKVRIQLRGHPGGGLGAPAV